MTLPERSGLHPLSWSTNCLLRGSQSSIAWRMCHRKKTANFHEKGLMQLSAEIYLDHGNIVTKARKLKGAEIILDFPSVTATENLLMAASLAEGETIIKNAAREPEVVFLAEMLSRMGANIKGAGEDTIYIKGKRSLKPVKIEIIPDRIEAGTFLVLSALLSENKVIVKNLPEEYLETPLLKLQEMGVKVERLGKGIFRANPSSETQTP